MSSTRVGLVCSEPIRPLMAGIGIRYIEMARALHGNGFEVSLTAPDVDQTLGDDLAGIQLSAYAAGGPATPARPDVLVIQGHLAEDVMCHRGDTPIVVDLYDPYLLENMAYAETLGPEVFARDHASWLTQMRRGDFFLCANPAQRDFYLGFLAALGRITPDDTRRDPTLHRLIDIVPFGVPSRIPDHRAFLPSRKSGETRILFGGLYDWYDPWTLLRAIDTAEFARCRVIFVHNPNPQTTPQKLLGEVKEWGREHGWTKDRLLFIDWAPFTRRFDLLRDVDMLVAPHTDTVETRFSMRTRFLEALAVGLPVIATAGGAMDAIITEYRGGRVVAPRDVDAMREALRACIQQPLKRADDYHRKRFIRDHDWERAIRPLMEFCRAPERRRTGNSGPAVAHPVDQPLSVPAERRRVGFLFSVVLPSHNRMDVLPDVIDALHNQYAPPDFELIVIDDGSSDGTLAWLKNHHFSIPVKILSQSNQGPAAARNRAVQAARGEYLVLLGDDMVPDRFWLRTHDQAHAKRGYAEHLVVIGQTDWHEQVKRSAFLRFVDRTGWQFGFDQIKDPENVDFNFFYGSNLSLRRRWLFENAFNTEFPFAAWEDIELGYRLRLLGLKFVFESGARTAHLHQTALRRMADRQRKTGYSAAVFCRLHPELESFLWPSRESLASASGTLGRGVRRSLAAVLEPFPVDLPRMWNHVLRDHYVWGIRQYLKDHGVDPSDPASILPSQLYPLVFGAASPLLKHGCGGPYKDVWRCVPERDHKGHCVYGPYLRMHKQQPLEVRFYIDADAASPHDRAAVSLDVYDATNDQVLCARSYESKHIDRAEYLALRFTAKPDQNLEFRVYWHAWCRIDVQRLELHDGSDHGGCDAS